ncbi:MAG: phosphatidate cytidylyltransferase [Candidatus Binatus sp.]|uniref:phosphatidate cytidylyltransferase n=1 Tax=Candidatus Binatus sp. TaxID=2811406 RepID=UPI00271A5088|nr:phosphatidate cytidylyltransferase [Candidatus Binatus sp.]MDO8433660.1 phosphatidate cytidylyltransferase [Candidatus Binatus sp.]
MLKTRLWTAAIALPVLLAAILFGSDSFFRLFIAVLGCFALYEIAAMTWAASPGRIALAIAILLAVGAVPLFALLYCGDAGWLLPTLVILMMLALMIVVARRGADAGPKGLALTAIGAAYAGVLFPYFALLRNSPRGIELLVLMLALVIASDTGAYFVGRGIGKTKLMPLVSPNKTVEGAIGGLVSSIIAGLMLRPMLAPDWSIAGAAIFSAAIAVLAQLGDLAGSALKRSAGVKDSGWLFPGHGGLIDRTCSLVLAAVFTYYYS